MSERDQEFKKGAVKIFLVEEEREGAMKRDPIHSRSILFASLVMAIMLGGSATSVPGVVAATGEPDVEIIMRNQAFKVAKGGGTLGWPTFRIVAGKETVIKLRNEDKVAHEFVSPMLREVEINLSGNATTIWTKKAAGVRIDPGQVVELRFVAPHSEDFKSLYEVFWCNVHGKELGAEMRGELIVAETGGKS